MNSADLTRKLGRRVIRIQARLESQTGDRWIPGVLGTLLTLFLIWAGLARLDGLETGQDLAGYSQAIWLLANGTQPEASMFGDGVHVLELHWSLVLYPLSLFARVFAAPRVLIVAQGIALGLGVPAIWGLARRVSQLRIGAATALVVAYAFHPVTHRLATNDFHPETLAVPALLGLALFGARRRWVWYWVCVVIVLACRADLGLAVALWGFVLLGDGERRAGLWTLGVGSVWSLGVLLVVQPIVTDAVITGGQYGKYGDSLGEVGLNGLRHPLMLLGDLVAEGNVTLLVGLLAPVIFLPLLSIRHFLPAIPLGALYLITDVQDSGSFAERSALLLAFVFIAASHAFNRLGQMGVTRVFVDARVLVTVISAAALLSISQSPVSPYRKPWNWSEVDKTDQAIIEAVADLDPEIAIRSSSSGLTVLSERYWLYPLDGTRAPNGVFDLVNVRALLIVDRDGAEQTDQERQNFADQLALRGYELRVNDRENGVALYFRP